MTFIIEAEDELYLPYFKGSTFRGAFGNTFRRLVCALKREDCKNCILKQSCIYSYIFETSPAEGQELSKIKKYQSIPRPFIIEPPLNNGKIYKNGSQLDFSVIVIGKAIQYVPYFIYTFHQCGDTGIGKGRGKFKLVSVFTDGKQIYTRDKSEVKIVPPKIIQIPEDVDFENSEEEELTLEFLTPARIKHKRDLVVELDFSILIKALLIRLNFLNFYHVEEREATFDYKKYIAKAKEIVIKENNTYWWDWERYSSRQKGKMKLGGICGKITYKGNIKPFMPYIKAGELLHVGKGTSFGLGKYAILQNK